MAVLTPQEELAVLLSGAEGMTSEALARLLSGHLPPVGSDSAPFEHIWQALREDEGRAAQQQALARLCACLLERVSAEDDRDYLKNLFRLGEQLQEPEFLFSPALALERRTESGELSLPPRLRLELRRLIIFNQADRSLRPRWIGIIEDADDARSPGDVLDALTGLSRLPTDDDSDIPVKDIREGLRLLGGALGPRANGEEGLRAALVGLRYTYVTERWAEWLAPDYEEWHPLLRKVALDEVPGLSERLSLARQSMARPSGRGTTVAAKWRHPTPLNHRLDSTADAGSTVYQMISFPGPLRRRRYEHSPNGSHLRLIEGPEQQGEPPGGLPRVGAGSGGRP